MVGPLLVYEERGEHEYVFDGSGGFRSPSTRRVVVYDEGTGHSWSLFNDAEEVQLARQGVVLWSRSFVSPGSPLLHVHADGRIDLLDDDWSWGDDFRVSPDGRNVLLRLTPGSRGRASIEVLSLPSAQQVLHLEDDAIASAAGVDPAMPWGLVLPAQAGVNGWTPDSSEVFVELLDFSDEHEHNPPRTNLVISLDGSVRTLVVTDSEEHVTQVDSLSRATTDCPSHPAKPCDILLDGEVIGEGRWPRIIGFIELD